MEAFMTSPIGLLPINSEGLRKAVDYIVALQEQIRLLSAVNQALCYKTEQLEMDCRVPELEDKIAELKSQLITKELEISKLRGTQ